MQRDNISYILPFSAKSWEALNNTSAQVMSYLKELHHIDLADASWTLQKGRRALEHRKVFVTSRKDMESSTFHVCSNNGKRKRNLVLILPGVQDVNILWRKSGTVEGLYPLLKGYERTVEQLLKMLPQQTAEKVINIENDDNEVKCYRALLGGYACVQMLRELGVQPSALVGEGIAELVSMVCAGAVTLRDAISIIQTYGQLATYEAIYEKYDLRKKQIPLIKKPGIKAKQHIEDALVIKLGSSDLENSITKRCMTNVEAENVLNLIENSSDSFINNVYRLIGDLWCRGLKIDWDMISAATTSSLKRVALPTYVFDKKEYDSDVVNSINPLPSNNSIHSTIEKVEMEQLDPAVVLRKLWEEVIGVTDIQKTSDFFEMGGDSLNAIMLSSKIKETLKIEFPVSDVFIHSTFGKMEQYIDAHLDQKSVDVIEKLGVQKYYEASSAQKRMYIMNELVEDAIPYNFAAVYHVKGRLEHTKIQQCFSKVVERHEAFKTRFDMVDGEIVQIIEDNVDFKVKFQTSEKERLEEAITANLKPFNLEKAPLLRVTFISLNEEEHVMVLDMHHIISDQSSLDILLKEIGCMYQGEELPDLEIQYKDFAKWQNDFYNSGKVQKQLDYWKNEFKEGVPVLDLYTDYDRPEFISYEGGKIHYSFEHDINQGILAFTKKHGITPYMFIMAALNIMLWKYTNQKDIVIGTVISGRNHAKLESIVGMFVNTLAIKSELDEDIPLEEFLQYTKNKLVKSYDNQDCQFELLVEELGIPKSVSRNPLFDILFNYINIGTDEVNIEGLSLTPYENNEINVKFDISFTLEEKNQQFYMDIDYSKALYKEDTIRIMGERLIYIISQMLKDVNVKLKDIDMMTVEERNWLIETVNQTTTDYPAHKTVLTIFEDYARDTPNAIAIEWLEDKISYKQLNNMANQLAEKLKDRNVGYQDKVAILLDRGYMQIVSMLGIMKLGAVYVPIDPKFPQERIDYILEDCHSKVIVTDYSLEEKISVNIEKFLIDKDENTLNREQDMGIESTYTSQYFNSDDLIYVIYTSGSTGKPKGTLIKHKNVVRVVKNTNYIDINENDRIMQISNYVFDCSVFDIYGALLNGANLVIIPRETSLDIPLLAEFIEKKEISVFCISTALFHMLVDGKVEFLKNVRKIIVAGEQISLTHAQQTVNQIGKGKLINAYGPSESAVFATYYPIDDIEDVSIIPIGIPISNTTVYVVDEKKQLVPMNVAGELCLGGDGVGVGYLNREDLTNEKFITLDAVGGKRVYCTGDKVMWNSRGQLVFLGRKDFQIKLRGFRVELGEVERHIKNIDGIKNVIVTAERDHLDTLYMTAYYTVNENHHIEKYDGEYVRNHLNNRLPEYMIPSKFVVLKEFPLNFSGKVDRKALVNAEQYSQKVMVQDEPRTTLEKTILKTMQMILDVKEFGLKDNFFHFGGQSIKAIALVKALSNKGVDLKINEIFQYQTAEKIAASIEPLAEVSPPMIDKIRTSKDIELNAKQITSLVKNVIARIEGLSDIITASDTRMAFSLSPIQKGHMSKGSNYSGFISHFDGIISKNRIKNTIADVISNNQLLHCSLVETDGEKKWCEHEVLKLETIMSNYLTYVDISMYTESVKTTIINKLSEEILLRTYSNNELLWRMCVLKESDTRHLIIWGADHLIFDGMSAEIIKTQIEQGLKGTTSMENTIRSFKEYVDVLNEGPLGISEKELIEKFNLVKWSENNRKVMAQPKRNTALRNNIEIIIPLSDKKHLDIWWYAFDFVSDILRDYTNTEVIPFAVLEYARSYQGKDFYNSVGEFLDIVPIISEKGNRTSVETAIQLCKDHSINYLALLGEERFSKDYPKLNQLLRKYYFNDKQYCNFILYNFQGFVKAEEKQAFSHNNTENSLARMSVTLNYDSDHLYIEIEDVIGIDEKKFRTIVEKRSEQGRVSQ